MAGRLHREGRGAAGLDPLRSSVAVVNGLRCGSDPKATPFWCSYHARVDSEAWARAEMAKAAADPSAFELRLKEQLERRLAGRRRFQAHDNDGVWVEEICLEGSYPGTTGVIILRDDRQPGCRFAWSLGDLWDWRDFENAGGAKPEDHAWWIELYLDEDVEAVNYGIPIRCVEDELNPVGLHEASLKDAARRAPFPVLAPSQAPAPGPPVSSTRNGAASTRSRPLIWYTSLATDWSLAAKPSGCEGRCRRPDGSASTGLLGGRPS